MKKLIISLCAISMLSFLPCSAQVAPSPHGVTTPLPRQIIVTEYVGLVEGQHQYKTAEGDLIILPMSPTDMPVIKKKLKWKHRHPVAYARANKVRKVCKFMLPIVSVGSEVCVVIITFLI